MEGKVIWFDRATGFGFIDRNDGGGHIYVHHSALLSEGRRILAEGDRVEFDIEQGLKGPQAVRVRVKREG